MGDLIRSVDASARFRGPADDAAIHQCELALGHPLAAGVAALLRECDGVQLANGLSIWPVARIAEVNAEMRTAEEWSRIHTSFAPLCFFGDPGTADRYGFVPVYEEDGRSGIFRWDHLNDSRTCAARHLEQLIRWSVGVAS